MEVVAEPTSAGTEVSAGTAVLPPAVHHKLFARWPLLKRLWERFAAFASGPWGPPALIVVALIVSTLERLHGLNYHYWIDEAISVNIAQHPLSDLHRLLKQDGSPPLWYLMLHFWIHLFNNRPTATHVLSLIPAQLSIPLTWWAARPLGRRVATFAVIIAALLSYTSAYGEETRMYAWMVLWGVLVCGSLLRVFVYRQRRYLPVFTLSLAASMYTHNWGLFLAVSSTAAVALLWWTAAAEARRALLIDGVIGLGIVALLYIPWLPTLLFQSAHTGAPWAERTVLWSWTQGSYFLTGGRAQASVLLLGCFGGLWSAYRFAPRRGAFRREVWVLLLLAIGTFFLAWMVGKVTQSFTFRYEAAIAAPLTLLVSVGLARGRGLAIAAIVLCCCWWLFDDKSKTLSAKSNVGTVAAQARHVMGSDPLVVSTQPEQTATLAYYMPWVHRFATPTGIPADASVVNWVGMLSRLEHATIRKNLQPLIRGLRPGQTVSLVIPYALEPTTKYLKIIDEDSISWRAWLQHNKSLKPLGEFQNGLKYSSGGVRDYVFKKL